MNNNCDSILKEDVAEQKEGHHSGSNISKNQGDDSMKPLYRQNNDSSSLSFQHNRVAAMQNEKTEQKEHKDRNINSGTDAVGIGFEPHKFQLDAPELNTGSVERWNSPAQTSYHYERWAPNWGARFRELVEYKNENEDCNVPARYEDSKALGRLVHGQRKHARRKKPTTECTERFTRSEFCQVGREQHPELKSKSLDERWNFNFEELVEYKNQNGDCNVPRDYKDNKSLSRWVSNQRLRQKALSNERIERLNQLGFFWGKNDDERWNFNFQQLVECKNAYGDCNVSPEYKNYEPLRKWVHCQRQCARNKTLSNERIELLNRIGFCWVMGEKQAA